MNEVHCFQEPILQNSCIRTQPLLLNHPAVMRSNQSDFPPAKSSLFTIQVALFPFLKNVVDFK